MSAAEIQPFPATGASLEVRSRAAALLEEGRVVAIPTETVYGLAARADRPEVLNRLRQIKGRAPDVPFTWHAPHPGAAGAGDPVLPALVARLAARFWPGPLTLVLKAAPEGLGEVTRDGWIGVRVPSHAGTAALLGDVSFPVVATSANLHGQTPCTDAAAVADLFQEQVSLVLDGGPASLRVSSTVARIGPGTMEVMREGVISADDLRRAGGLRLLFVCTGNTCRSPMAEGLARAVLRRRLESEDETQFGFEVSSAGMVAAVGAPASREAVDVLAAQDIDLSSHASRPALAKYVAAADRVFCLTAGHRGALLASLPPDDGDHVLLLDPGGGDIPDPLGGDLAVYRECARAIAGALEQRALDWI